MYVIPPPRPVVWLMRATELLALGWAWLWAPRVPVAALAIGLTLARCIA